MSEEKRCCGNGTYRSLPGFKGFKGNLGPYPPAHTVDGFLKFEHTSRDLRQHLNDKLRGICALGEKVQHFQGQLEAFSSLQV